MTSCRRRVRRVVASTSPPCSFSGLEVPCYGCWPERDERRESWFHAAPAAAAGQRRRRDADADARPAVLAAFHLAGPLAGSPGADGVDGGDGAGGADAGDAEPAAAAEPAGGVPPIASCARCAPVAAGRRRRPDGSNGSDGSYESETQGGAKDVRLRLL